MTDQSPSQDLTPITEKNFKYFEISKFFKVTINFVDKGTSLPTHTHDESVFNYVMDGQFTVQTNDDETTFTKGQWISIENNTPHSVHAKTDVTLLEL